MANRRGQKIKVDEDSEFDLAFSQESESPNTQAEQQKKLLQALAELRRKNKAEREKKTEKEKKFLQVIVKHIDRDLTKATDIIEETANAVEAEYSAFLSKYAKQEDKIHNLWRELQNEQAKLVEIANHKHQRKTKAVARTASTQQTALANIDAACNESQKIIDSLIPPSYSDSESDFDMTNGDN